MLVTDDNFVENWVNLVVIFYKRYKSKYREITTVDKKIKQEIKQGYRNCNRGKVKNGKENILHNNYFRCFKWWKIINLRNIYTVSSRFKMSSFD